MPTPLNPNKFVNPKRLTNPKRLVNARNIRAKFIVGLGFVGKLAICRRFRFSTSDTGIGRYKKWVFRQSLALTSVWVALSLGCGQSQGALLYMLGVGRAAKVSAEFEFGDGPLLILIDDPAERIEWPKTKKYLFDELAQNLLRVDATKKIIPLQTLVNLQQSMPGFVKRGCREVGERVGADEVLWIEVQDFSATQDFENITAAAFATVAVKVINVHETRRSRVRSWPPSPVGHRVTVSLSGSEVAVHKSKGAISRALADRLAMHIARLFHEYQPGDFEKTQ